MSERYDRTYEYGTVSFYLENFLPDMEECRILMLKVLEQTIRDYITLDPSKSQNDFNVWDNARSFLFEEDYFFMWGDKEITTETFLDILDLNIKWIRSFALKQRAKACNECKEKHK